ncbi:DNA gyrase inhibitor [Ammoniphilus sp. CFH 90114]|nr:DNA gyrase inhibitor [Ammoniphilus sp. CFH 90114]
MRRVGPYGPANIEVMEKLKKWAKEKNFLESAILFAIPQDNPVTTLPDHCRFDACIVIPNDFSVDDSVLDGELFGGHNAVMEVPHVVEDLVPSRIPLNYFPNGSPTIGKMDITQFDQIPGLRVPDPTHSNEIRET